jgi:hypothetical protein
MMDGLETLIRDTLAEHAADAPDASVLGPRPARRSSHRAGRRWLTAGLAAAAVVTVSIALVALRSDPSPKPSTTTPLPAGFKLVSYHGIEIGVPEAIRVDTALCAPTQIDVVVVDAGIVHGCAGQAHAGPPPSPAGLTVVSLDSTEQYHPGLNRTLPTDGPTSELDGHRAFRSYPASSSVPGITGVLVVPDYGVQVTVTAPTRVGVDQILDTVRVSPVDHLGCPDRGSTATPFDHRPADSLVPGRPTSVVTCHYHQFVAGGPLWLTGSGVTVPAADLPALVDELNALPEVDAATAGAAAPRNEWLVFGYADGTQRAVFVAGADSGAVIVGHSPRFAQALEYSPVAALLYPTLGSVR